MEQGFGLLDSMMCLTNSIYLYNQGTVIQCNWLEWFSWISEQICETKIQIWFKLNARCTSNNYNGRQEKKRKKHQTFLHKEWRLNKQYDLYTKNWSILIFGILVPVCSIVEFHFFGHLPFMGMRPFRCPGDQEETKKVTEENRSLRVATKKLEEDSCVALLLRDLMVFNIIWSRKDGFDDIWELLQVYVNANGKWEKCVCFSTSVLFYRGRKRQHQAQQGDLPSHETQHSESSCCCRHAGSKAVAETRGYRPAFIHGISNRCRGFITRGVHWWWVGGWKRWRCDEKF